VGESSGDALGAGVVNALKSMIPDIEIHGIAGEKMQKAGVKSLFDVTEISLMGFIEVVPKLFNIFRRINQTVYDIIKKRPDVLITIDSSGFNFRVVRKLRKKLGRDIKIVHYVAPCVWAYKPQRAKTVAELYDHLLTILPFETPYFEKEGCPVTYVGHPLSQINHTPPKLGDEVNLLVMPGSRLQEVRKMGLIFAEAIEILKRDHKKINV
jgi:lipid-A-disaccharide synthase